MAKKTIVEWVDDVDGTTAAETVTFSVDGFTYEIDLSDENAAKLRAAMSRWIDAGRRTGRRRVYPGPAKPDTSESTNARKWALDNGFEVGPRGRLRSEVLNAYKSQTPRK